MEFMCLILTFISATFLVLTLNWMYLLQEDELHRTTCGTPNYVAAEVPAL